MLFKFQELLDAGVCSKGAQLWIDAFGHRDASIKEMIKALKAFQAAGTISADEYEQYASFVLGVGKGCNKESDNGTVIS